MQKQKKRVSNKKQASVDSYEQLWPRCSQCGKSVSLDPGDAGEVFATCCGVQAQVRLAWVGVDVTKATLAQGKAIILSVGGAK